ncbi:MAG: AI-2E family transporter [Bacteroidales bacterium]|nr:AI-2E family transporter [Bacteroidales bacterium]
MNKTGQFILGGLLFVLGIYMIWFFSDIVVYILVSGVLSFMGHPLVSLFDRIRIRNVQFPHSLSAVLALIIILGVMVSLVLLFIPLVAGQAETIAGIDIEKITFDLQSPIASLQDFLIRYNIIADDQTIESSIKTQLQSVLSMATFANFFNNLISLTGTLFIAVFTVVFLTFFFLRDRHLFFNGILLFVPVKYEEKAANALNEIKNLLSRYFIGLSLEVISMITLLTSGLLLLGVENALLIGFLGGFMNIIPYLGPVIGAIMGVIIAVTSSLSAEIYSGLLDISLRVVGAFVVANLIDNLVLQPVIYSNSVKAHPIEIFLVILMAGSLAGVPGMILAIPGYTVIRIVAKEFLSQFKLVKKLTAKI